MKSRLVLLLLVLLIPLAARAQNPNEELIATSKKADLAALKAALAKGADINARTNYGATALHFAADGKIKSIWRAKTATSSLSKPDRRMSWLRPTRWAKP